MEKTTYIDVTVLGILHQSVENELVSEHDLAWKISWKNENWLKTYLELQTKLYKKHEISCFKNSNILLK